MHCDVTGAQWHFSGDLICKVRRGVEKLLIHARARRSLQRAEVSSEGEYILASSSHFVALRSCDGKWQINFGHRRHLWETAVVSDTCGRRRCTSQGAYSWDPDLRAWCVQTKFVDAVFKLCKLEPRNDHEDAKRDDVEGGSEGLGIPLHGWLQIGMEGQNVFLPFGLRAEQIVSLLPTPVSAQNAAAWFLSTMPNVLEWYDWLPSFPLEVTACIQFEIFQWEQCPVEQKAWWYVQWWLSMANLHPCVSLEGAEEILLLWAYTWPSSSLKEALCRLGARTTVAYHEVSTIAAWNSRAWDSNVFLVPWLGENALDQGNFILQSHGVCSALWVKDTEAQWMCGRVQVDIPCQNLPQFLAANEDVEVYRLVAWSCIRLLPLDVCGGAVQEHAKPQVGDCVLALQETPGWWKEQPDSSDLIWDVQGGVTDGRGRERVVPCAYKTVIF